MNPNHPKKGSIIKVEPIRETTDIDRIKNILEGRPRDYALFTLGINTNLRASDLLRITVDQVDSIPPGGSFTIREKKRGRHAGSSLTKRWSMRFGT